MRRNPVRAAPTVLVSAMILLLGGCSEQFTNEEMHLGAATKPRPLAILCEPPEAAPGQTVNLTLVFHETDAADTDVAWRVALDYDPGLYGADIIERRIVDLNAAADIPAFADDGHGFRTQTFAWTVPDSTILWASSLPSRIDDEAILALAAVVLPAVPADEITKEVIDAYLRGLTPADLFAMDLETLAAHQALADLFACQIRLRARLRSDLVVDVTRGLTVRYSSTLGSANVNTNPEVSGFTVIGIPVDDFDWSDLDQYHDSAVFYPFTGGGAVLEAHVPRQAGWTYYVFMQTDRQSYTSPFTPDRLFEEQATARWYFFRLDAPAAGQDFFVTDEGESAEMFALDESVRLQPPTDGSSPRFRVALCARDQRPEWEMYHGTPGATLVYGDIVFE